MSGNSPMNSNSKTKHTEVPFCDDNTTILHTSEFGRSDQVVTPTSLEQENTCSSSSLKRSLSKNIDETPLKRMKNVNEEKKHEECPAANLIEQKTKNGGMQSLSGITRYLQNRNIALENESIRGYKELEEVNISAQAQIDKLKSLNTFQQIDNFDWSKIEEAYAFIFSDYIRLMEHTIRDLDQSMKERRAWQEIIFTLDRERSAERINKSERWITAKEMNFNSVKQDLASSVELIQKEFLKFKTPKKKTHSPFDINS